MKILCFCYRMSSNLLELVEKQHPYNELQQQPRWLVCLAVSYNTSMMAWAGKHFFFFAEYALHRKR